jgi:hypothetical protein
MGRPFTGVLRNTRDRRGFSRVPDTFVYEIINIMGREWDLEAVINLIKARHEI